MPMIGVENKAEQELCFFYLEGRITIISSLQRRKTPEIYQRIKELSKELKDYKLTPPQGLLWIIVD